MRSIRERRSGEQGSSTDRICANMPAEITGQDAMNRIVREHYPVANLPEDLREGLDAGAMVRVVVEVAPAPPMKTPDFSSENEKPLTVDDFKSLIAQIRAQNRPSVSAEEAVARIRELRDEWDY